MIAVLIVLLAWLVFAAAFALVRPAPPPVVAPSAASAAPPDAPAAPASPARAARRDPRSRVGVGLQMVGFFLMWFNAHPPFPLFARAPRPVAWLAMGFAIALAYASGFLTVWARRTLGREWSITARVLEGHRLVTGGPYAIVRHPIYAAMLGLWIATALALSWPLGAAAGLVPMLWGTLIRTRSEDALLRATFGAEYESWARRVPALVPGTRIASATRP
jgi:protein-S-isoprenylcysteine O-methyltransferase Ste14